MPRVTVLVAAYNAERTIRATLRSLTEQTFSDWDAVVGDDCSTDGTAAIARSFDHRVRVVRSERNRGHAAPTRNLAARHTSSELIAFLDGDDRWLPRYLETMVGAWDRAASSGARLGALGCDALLTQGSAEPSSRTYFDVLGRTQGPVTLRTLLRGNPLYASALIDRATFEELGGLSEDLRGSDDYDLWIRIAETGRDIRIIDEPLAVYRVHGAQLSADTPAMERSTAEVYRRALRRNRLTRSERMVAARSYALHRTLAAAPWLTRWSRHSRAGYTRR